MDDTALSFASITCEVVYRIVMPSFTVQIDTHPYPVEHVTSVCVHVYSSTTAAAPCGASRYGHGHRPAFNLQNHGMIKNTAAGDSMQCF